MMDRDIKSQDPCYFPKMSTRTRVLVAQVWYISNPLTRRAHCIIFLRQLLVLHDGRRELHDSSRVRTRTHCPPRRLVSLVVVRVLSPFSKIVTPTQPLQASIVELHLLRLGRNKEE